VCRRFTQKSSNGTRRVPTTLKTGYTGSVTPLLDFPSHTVLAHFAPHTDGLTWTRAGGGFSGARVFRGTADTPRVALKEWPPGTSPERVRQIHTWLARAAHLPFVPTVFPGAGRHTVFAGGDRVWDCCRWMLGAPRTTPTVEEVTRACEAVARLHNAWAAEAEVGPCPGVQNRLRALAENESLLAAGPGALLPVSPLLDPLLRRAVFVAARAAPRATRELRPWAEHPFTLHPCVRDLRADHVLFSDGRVGIIDFGAMAVDHPAVDITRLLGDFASPALFASGLNAYRSARTGFDTPDEFVGLLARAGAVCSVLGWLVRLVVRRDPVPDPSATALRLASLITRAEEFAHV
jgi:hypothetical protein